MNSTLLLLLSFVMFAEAYVIGGGTQSGGTTYNSPTYSSGIGGGVSPGGSNNNNGGSIQRDEGGYCNSNSDCRLGLSCTSSVNGVKICLSSSNNGGSTSSGCLSSANCRSGSVCVINNGVGSCEIQTGGYVSPARQEFTDEIFDKNAPEVGKLNSACERDADCDSELSCTLYFGEMMCRFPLKPLIPLRCESDAECPSTEYLCVFSTAMQDKVCYKYGDVVTDGYVIPIKHKTALETRKSTTSAITIETTSSAAPTTTTTTTKTTTTTETNGVFAESQAVFDSSTIHKRADEEPVAPTYLKMTDDASEDVAEQHDAPAVKVTDVLVVTEERQQEKDEPIDPMATVCQFDYHCRMGESCSGKIRFVDRNVTVCKYDILKKHRQCIYHSDCLTGQRCTPTSKSSATCETDISATLGAIPCFYDYECSGGEKCTSVGSDEAPKKFVCRPSPTPDPRMNQLCTTNAQCPFQQVCRQSTGIAMCVDVSIARNPALLHERVWRFLRNFIFRKL